MNKSILMGRLVRDPEVRYSQTEKGELAVANFRIAVDRKFVKKDGVTADYFSCSAFGRLAEFAENYLLQGVKVVVTGRMENENYTNRDGNQVYGVRLLAEDIEFAESKKAMEDRMNEEENERSSRSSGRSAQRGGSDRDRRSESSSRARNAESSRRNASSRQTSRDDDDYMEEQEESRDVGRRNSVRNGSGRGKSSQETSGRRSERKRSIDDEFMDAPDDVEEDFD